MDGSKINQKKKKGFTLIELLAVIAILAIVSVIVIFTATSVIGKARAKSYLASISNIEKNSSSYAVENNNSIRWISTDDNNGEYYCVTVKDLMDIGSFDKDVLESEIDKGVFVQESDYIYLERDVNTKTVTKSILIAGKNKDLDYCDDYKTDGIISFSTATGWSNNKDVVIDYYILNFKGNVDDYEYYYKREDTGEEVRNKFNNASSMSIKVEDFKAEEIIARIYYQNMKIVERTFRTKIDKVKPEIELLVNDGTSYKKGNDIYINLLDKDSGFKRGKHKVYYKWSLNELTCDEIISNGDYVELSVDANNLNKSNTENLYLTNNSGTGKIYACSDSVYDYVGNKLEGVYSADVYLDNDKPIISLGNYEKNNEAHTSTKVELLVNDDTSGIKDEIIKEELEVTIGNKVIDVSNLILTKKEEEKYELVINNKTEHGEVIITVKKDSVEDKAGNTNDEYEFKPEIIFKNVYNVNYNANGGTGSMMPTECLYGEKCTLEKNSFTRTGYKFIGWNTKPDGSAISYVDEYLFESYLKIENITLYAQWEILDKIPPICTLSVEGTTITASSSDSGGSGILYNGWESSYSGSNSITTKISGAKKYTYYVKDNAGNTGSCSISIANIEEKRSEYCATGGTWPNCQSCHNVTTYCYTCFNNSGGNVANATGFCNTTGSNPCQGYSTVSSYTEEVCTSVPPSVSTYYSCPSGYLSIKNNSKYCYK